MKKITITILIVTALSLAVTFSIARAKAVRCDILEKENEELKAKIKVLEEMPSINQQVTFNYSNKAVFGSVKSGDFTAVSEQLQKVTRKALLELDTNQ